MCYQYNRDFGRDVRKDAAKESEERAEPRAEEKDVRFWAFPRRSREFTVEEPAPVDRTREKV
ncbi:MAG: hypothetical protein JWM01_252 [Arthrobacter sp.]|jgi:hypothetical protein|nr:hypothetical protein [Arthrobacter sp.]MCU1539305.1 hypothetical protein [Arthrobacter sp.]MCU1555050.1 hypothetical protein [Arthrobacter sp.]